MRCSEELDAKLIDLLVDHYPHFQATLGPRLVGSLLEDQDKLVNEIFVVLSQAISK